MSKAKKHIIYALALIIPIILAVFLIYKMNAITLSDAVIKNAGKVTSSVINQAIFILALEIFGLLVMMCFNRYFTREKIVALSYIVAVLMWCLASVIIVCIGIGFKWYYIAIILLAALIFLFLKLKPSMLTKKDLIFYIKTVVLYASLALFFSSLCIYRFSYDSYMYINTGQKIAKLGYLPYGLIPVVSGFSLFTPMMFAPSEFFGYDFSQGLYLLLNVQFTLFVGYVIYDELEQRLGIKKSIIAGVVSVLALVSSNIYLELMYWPMSNLLTAMTMFGLLYFAWRAERQNHSINMLISAFFGICFVLIRSENMLLYVCFMFIVSLRTIKKKELALHLTSAAGALALWYFRFFSVAGINFSEGAFLTSKRAAGVIAIFLLFILYVLFISGTYFIQKRKKLIERIFYLAMFLAIAGLAFLNPDFFAENVKSTLHNVFYDGAWAGALILIGAMYLAKLFYINGINFFDRQILVFLLFFMIIFLLRSMPLRIGFGDSGSRYFAHLIPIIVFSISTSFGKKLSIS